MDAALGVVHDGGKYLIAITCTRIRYSFILHMVYKNVILNKIPKGFVSVLSLPYPCSCKSACFSQFLELHLFRLSCRVWSATWVYMK